MKGRNLKDGKTKRGKHRRRTKSGRKVKSAK